VTGPPAEDGRHAPRFARLRQVAKSIPPLYWSVGAIRYLQFRRDLRTREREYAARADHRNPPPMLRYRVHRSFDERGYEAMGHSLAEAIVGCLREEHVELEGREVLDFACGPGRVIRDFHAMVPSARLTGSDIDAEAIGWANSHLGDIAKFRTNGCTPPTGFEEAMFDIVYCISLFTHLDESSQYAWLAELSRLLRPGGVLLTSVHGDAASGPCTRYERAALERDGIVFRVDHKGRFKLDGLPDFYQTTFHTRRYIERHWTRHFDLRAYREGGLHGHQDLVLLAKR
jgi:2-polyprenyl-3-methyl-5-hydroxy-6-metoxy-1,4-benzoquinol methylase